MSDVVLADPPWSYYPSTHTHQIGNHYGTLAYEQIVSHPYWEHVDKLLFLWATCPKLDEAMSLGHDLGLFYRGTSFVWVKTRRDGEPLGAMGVRPSITKPVSEMVLAFSTVRKGRPLPVADETVRQVVMAPIGKHSAKPEEVQDRIEMLYPTASKCELFARRKRSGWLCVGQELEFDNE
jgi:site-specific DNA-methyltransferase (adenine-specific)